MRKTSLCIAAKACGGYFVRIQICALALFFAGASFASESVQNLGESSVYGESFAAKAEQSTSSYAEILPEAWEARGLSAAEVLATLPGVQSYSQGGVGSFQTVSIRGIAAKNVVICVDGIPLNDASGGAVNLGTIDLNQIEKIEVYKDRVPAKFGGRGIGGAINFVTKGSKPAEMALASGNKNSGRLLLSYGSHNTWEASTQMLSRLTDSISVNASVAARHSDNDYEFESENGTQYNQDDDFTDTRKNAQFTEYSGLFKLRVLHSNGVFSTLNFNFNRSEGGNPGREDFQTSVAGYNGEFAEGFYRAELPQLWNWLWLEFSLAGKFEKALSHSYYPLDHLGYASSEYLEYGTAGYTAVPEVTASYLGERLESNLRLSLDASYYSARGSSRNWNLTRYATTASEDVSYKVIETVKVGGEASALFIRDDIHGGKFVLPTMTKTLKTAENRKSSYSGRGFVQFDSPESVFGANVSFGRFFRAPQLMELYGVYPGVISNPELKEESALRFEAGSYFAVPHSHSVLRATYFETHSQDGIYWVTSGSFMKPMNIGEARIRGLEAELESNPEKWLSVVLRATFQKTEDRSDEAYYRGNKLPYEPARSYYAETKVLLPLHFNFTWSSEARTKIFSDRANRIEQPAVALHHFALGFNPFSKTRFVFALRNLTDETYRNLYTPYPTPGREYKLTFTQGF